MGIPLDIIVPDGTPPPSSVARELIRGEAAWSEDLLSSGAEAVADSAAPVPSRSGCEGGGSDAAAVAWRVYEWWESSFEGCGGATVPGLELAMSSESDGIVIPYAVVILREKVQQGGAVCYAAAEESC
eukprot:Sspe_Gene.95045::Locus_67380_Transcript_1_1_Confidence_1.000_Length_1791::g.95045::m.95045